MPPTDAEPEAFTRAVAGLRGATVRPEIGLEEIAAPKRLAPFAFALAATVSRGGEETATGRLILLHEPAGHEAWRGTVRLVTYVTADLEPDLAGDPLLPGVGWTWLTDALAAQGADHTALGGTVTLTASTRFGELATTQASADLEIRASWTPIGEDLGPHLHGWCALLSSVAGLPPPGVTALPERRRAPAV